MTKRRTFGIAGVTLALSLCLLYAADRAREQKYQQAVDLMESKGDVKGAMRLFEEVSKSPDRNLAARSLLYLGSCYEKLGQDGAQKAYDRIVREFADQPDVLAKARNRLVAIGGKPRDGEITAQLVARQAFAPTGVVTSDGRYIPSISRNGHVVVYDLVSGETRYLTGSASAERGKEGASSVTASADGKQFAYTWNTTTGSTEIRVVGPDGASPRVVFSDNNRRYGPGVVGWAPDGKYILALTYGVKEQFGSNPETVLVSVADRSAKVITKGWISDDPYSPLGSSPKFSPDGKYLLYAKSKLRPGQPGSPSEKMDLQIPDIFTLAVETGRETRLVENPARDWSPVWTPDGSRVLFFSDRTGTVGLWSLRVVDGQAQGSAELIRPNIGDTRSRTFGMTRDGTYYYQQGAFHQDVYVADLDPQTCKAVGEPKRITQRGVTHSPMWSPDGQYLAYHAHLEGVATMEKLRLLIRSMKTGEEVLVSPKPAVELSWRRPQWHPDSRSLIIGVAGARARQIDVASGEHKPFLESVALGRTQRLPPDLKTVFSEEHDEKAKEYRIYRRDLESGETKELWRSTASLVFSLAISNDGRQLAFIERRGTSDWFVMTIPAGGGQPRELYQAKPPQTIFSSLPEKAVWSADGRFLMFMLGNPKGEELWAVPASGGAAFPVGVPGQPATPDVRPDGKQLAFTYSENRYELWALKNLLSSAKASK